MPRASTSIGSPLPSRAPRRSRTSTPASAAPARTSFSPATPTWCRRARTRTGPIRRSPARSSDDTLYGRGAVDMKGAVACAWRPLPRSPCGTRTANPRGRSRFSITGDEESIAVNGTVKLLKWAAERGEAFDHCILGEPSNTAGARRHHQDRPARLAQRHAGDHRQAGPRRLSGARRQSGARPGRAHGRADGRAARPAATRISTPRTSNSRRSTSAIPVNLFPARHARASTSASTTTTARSC